MLESASVLSDYAGTVLVDAAEKLHYTGLRMQMKQESVQDGLMEEENGWCFYAACLDCGAHTAEIRYERDAERLDAAQRAAHLWNIGKVLTDTPND